MPTVNDANGTPARVLDNGYMLNYAASMAMSAHAGDLGDAYSLNIDVTIAAADQDVGYIQNLSDKILRIYKIKTYCLGDTEIQFKVACTGAPGTPDTITPVNALVGCGILAEGVFNSRSGDMALVGGDLFDTIVIDTSVTPVDVSNYPGEIALLKNQTFLVNQLTDPGVAINMTIFFYYHGLVE